MDTCTANSFLSRTNSLVNKFLFYNMESQCRIVYKISNKYCVLKHDQFLKLDKLCVIIILFLLDIFVINSSCSNFQGFKETELKQ